MSPAWQAVLMAVPAGLSLAVFLGRDDGKTLRYPVAEADI
jgi:hypothetical protein